MSELPDPHEQNDEDKQDPVESAGDDETESPGRRMSLWEHLDELRKRLITAVAVWLLGTCVAWAFLHPLMKWVTAPAGDIVLHPRTPLEGMLTLMKVAMAAGFVATSPIILYQVWAFVSPALHPHEKRWVYRFFVPVAVLFFAGVGFAYWALSRVMLAILINYPKRFGMDPIIAPEPLISFILFVCLACGLVFQMPVITYVLSKIGILSPQYLISQWKFIVVGLLIAAGVLTPSPDIPSQFILFVPLMLLYGVSYFVARAAYPRPKL
ncbi:MAG: twin-arginine translocase subunit TatC [bacterium]